MVVSAETESALEKIVNGAVVQEVLHCAVANGTPDSLVPGPIAQTATPAEHGSQQQSPCGSLCHFPVHSSNLHTARLVRPTLPLERNPASNSTASSSKRNRFVWTTTEQSNLPAEAAPLGSEREHPSAPASQLLVSFPLRVLHKPKTQPMKPRRVSADSCPPHCRAAMLDRSIVRRGLTWAIIIATCRANATPNHQSRVFLQSAQSVGDAPRQPGSIARYRSNRWRFMRH